jgi:hypothetical protein
MSSEVVHSVITVTKTGAGPGRSLSIRSGMTPGRIVSVPRSETSRIPSAAPCPARLPAGETGPGNHIQARREEISIIRFDEHAGVVEVRGLDEPYSQFFKIEALSETFLPP